MRFSLRHWRPRHLLLAWGGYWLALLAFALGPAALAVSRMTRGPRGSSSVSANFDDVIRLTVVDHGATVWAGSASPLTVVLWLTGPPLALWLLWLLARPARGATAPDALAADERAALRPADDAMVARLHERAQPVARGDRER